MSYGETDTDRRIGNIVQYGKVKSVGTDGTAVVEVGGVETDSLPIMRSRAGGTRTSNAPTVGEQVALICPGGELGDALIIGSISQDEHPDAGNNDQDATIYPDGTRTSYDHASHTLTIDCSAASGTVVIKAQSITLDTPETVCTGNLTVAKSLTLGTGGGTANITGNVAITGGSLTHNGKNVGSTHAHSGVQPGGGNTADPV